MLFVASVVGEALDSSSATATEADFTAKVPEECKTWPAAPEALAPEARTQKPGVKMPEPIS